MKYFEVGKYNMKKLWTFAIFAVFVFSGCTGLVEKTGRVVDGTAFAEKTVASYSAQKESEKKKSKKKKKGNSENTIIEVREIQDKSGLDSLVISFEALPCLRIRGSAPDAVGNFYFSSIDYLAGSLSGWNEFIMELSGTGMFKRETETALLCSTSTLEQIEITNAKILHNDTRIIGDEALSALRNRRERIDALTSWMKNYVIQQGKRNFADSKEFDSYFKPILLPELCEKEKRPSNYSTKGVQWERALDVKWNKSYSDILFFESDAQKEYSVEELKKLRNSGTLMRDWEEALEWVWIQYNWESIVENLSAQTTVYRTKK